MNEVDVRSTSRIEVIVAVLLGIVAGCVVAAACWARLFHTPSPTASAA